MRAWLLLPMLDFPAPFVAIQAGWIRHDAPWGPGLGPALGAAVLISIPVVGLNVIFSELVAKSYSALHPHRVALRLYSLHHLFQPRLRHPGPPRHGCGGALHRSGSAPRRPLRPGSRAEEEIRGILENYEETGEIEEQESEMLHSVFEFGDTVAREVMTPRTDVEAYRPRRR